MKHLFIFLLALMLLSCGGQGYTISGTVSSDGLNGKTLYLRKIPSNKVFDSAVVSGKSFTFKGRVDYPVFSIVSEGNRRIAVPLFVENADIKLSIDTEDLSNHVVSGSKLNDLFTGRYLPVMKSYEKKMNELYGNVMPDNMDEARAKQELILNEMVDSMKTFISENPGTLLTALALTNAASKIPVEEIQKIFDGLDEGAKNSEIGDFIRITIEKKSSPDVETGQKYRNMTMKTPEGNDISISDYAGKGKYVLLDFWASWCGPCRQENPNVVALYEKYKSRDFEIIGISLDDNKEQWIKGIADDKITWIQMSDLKGWNSEATVKYRINGIPSTVLLDREGTITDINLRGETLAGKLKEIFPE